MTKKNFVALADVIRNHNALLDCTRNPGYSTMRYNVAQIASLAGFCQTSTGNEGSPISLASVARMVERRPANDEANNN